MIYQTPLINAATAAERWQRCYRYSTGGKTAALKELGPHPSVEAVDSVIGNTGWTKCVCTECHRGVDAVMQFGEEDDHEASITVWLCRDCIVKALAMFDSVEVKQ